jgi:hypothetical protein
MLPPVLTPPLGATAPPPPPHGSAAPPPPPPPPPPYPPQASEPAGFRVEVYGWVGTCIYLFENMLRHGGCGELLSAVQRRLRF